MNDGKHTGHGHVADVAYTSRALTPYDVVLKIISGTFWGCTAARVVEFYNQHVSGNHLDIGIGTGYFLDHCRFPTAKPRLTLMDSNQDPLDVAGARLGRYAPSTLRANIMEPIPFEGPKYDSVGMNHLIHCLPGKMQDKGRALQNVKALMNDGAVVFGATVLGKGVEHNLGGWIWLMHFNRKGVLDNIHDSHADLKAMLDEHFSRSSVDVVGRTALFAAWK